MQMSRQKKGMIGGGVLFGIIGFAMYKIALKGGAGLSNTIFLTIARTFGIDSAGTGTLGAIGVLLFVVVGIIVGTLFTKVVKK